MAGRLNKVYTLPSDMYSEGCPVVVSAGALYTDTESGKVLAQLKLKNISDKSVASCKISVKAYENNGDELKGVEGFSYLDLNVGPGEEFGSKIPVFMPDQTTRSIAVSIDEIVYLDKTVEKQKPQEWKPVPARKTVADMMGDPALIEQIRLDYGEGIDFVPVSENGLFLCSCGAVNLGEDSVCYNCGKTYESLVKILDKDDLTVRLSDRLDREAAEREEERLRKEARQEAARLKKEEQIKKARASGKKAAKIAGVVAAAVVLAFIAKAAVTSIMTANKYRQANEFYENREYAQAIEKYDEIDGYKDSNDRKAASYANLAVQYLEKNDCSKANETLKYLNEYQFTNKEWEKEADNAETAYYNKVVALAEKGEYENAVKSLSDIIIPDYIEYLQYCRSRLALQLVKDNKLEDAREYLVACEKTSKYEKERTEAFSKYYEAVASLIKNKKYEEGSKLMKDLNYEDSAKYYEYCTLGMDSEKPFDDVNLSVLYKRIANLGKDFKLANGLIEDNQYLSEIASLDGTWKAEGSTFYGGLLAEKYRGTIATLAVNDGVIVLTDDSYSGSASDRDTNYIFTVDDGKLVIVPEYDFTEGTERNYEYDDYKAKLEDGAFTFRHHNEDVPFSKE